MTLRIPSQIDCYISLALSIYNSLCCTLLFVISFIFVTENVCESGADAPWMLMKKVPALSNLVVVQGGAELNMLDRLLSLLVELLHPPRFVAVHRLVELLEYAEIRAGWRPYQ